MWVQTIPYCTAVMDATGECVEHKARTKGYKKGVKSSEERVQRKTFCWSPQPAEKIWGPVLHELLGPASERQKLCVKLFG